MVKPLNRNELQEALRICKGSFITAGVFSMFINLLMLVPPFYMLQTYDRVISSGNKVTLLMLTLIMVFLMATMGGLDWVRSRVLVRASSKMDTMLADKMFNTSHKQALYSSGTVTDAQPIKDLEGLRTFMTGNGFFAFFDAPWLPFYIAIMFMFHFWFGVVAIIAAIALVIIALLNEKVTAPLFAEASKEQSIAQHVASTNLRNAEVIESMGMLDNIRNLWREKAQGALYWQSLASDKASGFTSFSKVFRLVTQSLTLGLGALLVLNQELSPGAMIAGSILLGRALGPIDLLIGSWKPFVAARSQYVRLNALLDKIPADTQKMTLPTPKGAIALEQVVLGPPGAKTPILKGVNFTVDPGDIVGVIGPSASGKSTLARGILGIWPAMNGVVRLDGADIKHYNREEIGPYVGYLPQDIELFAGTVSDNIARFGSVDSQKVVAAAMAAGVHELIQRLPNGYDTQIGLGGNALSGGQRQRIALARALYDSPAVVVLDEPNSNLDDAGELALTSAIAGLKERGCTTIIITHRPNILNAVDKILVMREGTVAGYGPKDKVLEAMKAGQKPQSKQLQGLPQQSALAGAKE